MHDLQRGLVQPGPSSSTSTAQRNGATDILEVGIERSRSYENPVDSGGGNGIAFQTKFEDGHGECSPPLWKKKTPVDVAAQESSPLLPHNHQYSHSPELRLEAVTMARKELMDMVGNMPEDYFELSLQDIVLKQERTTLRETQAAQIKEKGLSSDTEGQVKKQKKKRNNDRGQAFQSESLDSRKFLLKMFIPFSPGSRKSLSSNAMVSPRPSIYRTDNLKESGRHSMVYEHSAASPRSSLDRTEILRESRRNSTACSRLVASRRPSIDGAEKLTENEWWKKRHAAQGDSKSSGRSSSCGSTSSNSNSNGSRHTDDSVQPSCWPSFNTRKSKMK